MSKLREYNLDLLRQAEDWQPANEPVPPQEAFAQRWFYSEEVPEEEEEEEETSAPTLKVKVQERYKQKNWGPCKDNKTYRDTLQRAIATIENAGPGPRRWQAGLRIKEQDPPKRIFKGEDVYKDTDSLEGTLLEAYRTLSPFNHAEEMGTQHDLSRIITGNGTIEFLIYGKQAKIAKSYVHALHKQTKTEQEPPWPFSEEKIEKRFSAQKKVEAFKKEFEIYAKNPTKENLVRLFKQTPSLTRGYIALVGNFLDKDSKGRTRPWYHFAYKTFKQKGKEKKAIPLTEIIDNIEEEALKELEAGFMRLHAHAKIAKDMLTERFIGLATMWAQGWKSLGLKKAISIAYEGLERAVVRFDYTPGYTFQTYATIWIQQALGRAYQTSGEIRLPIEVAKKVHRLAKVKRELSAKLARAPTDEEITKKLEWSKEELKKIREMEKRKRLIPLDAPVRGAEKRRVGECIADISATPVDEMLVEDQRKQLVNKLLSRAHLTTRERDVLIRYSVDGLSFQKIADEYGLTREAIRRTYIRTKKKLRQAALGFSKDEQEAMKENCI